MAQELTFNKSVAIIGAGPAGSICAKFLIDSGIIPTIFDKGKYLRTILPTGGGRCNLAHSEFDFKELAKNMRIERARLNISQLKLAEMADVSLDTINMIERGVGNPKFCTVISIAKALNVDLNTLLKL